MAIICIELLVAVVVRLAEIVAMNSSTQVRRRTRHSGPRALSQLWLPSAIAAVADQLIHQISQEEKIKCDLIVEVCQNV